MEPEKKRVPSRVRVEPTRPENPKYFEHEPDPKNRYFSGNPTRT
jgi:hypothetical protein